MQKPYVIGVDIGGQSTQLGVADARGNIVAQTPFDSTGITRLEDYLKAFTDGLNRLINNPTVGGKDNVKGIGIGA
ncbi:MAG TPA: ROK family protein, partial [Bacteroidales bacterium]|nr:ROK family protein [Bacteroidales bacterium]